MTQRLIKNYALLIDKKNNAHPINNCMTFTDLQIVEFATEKEMQVYIKTKKLNIEETAHDITPV